jgi:hypothetical protein
VKAGTAVASEIWFMVLQMLRACARARVCVCVCVLAKVM